jgi:hypothetical protein
MATAVSTSVAAAGQRESRRAVSRGWSFPGPLDPRLLAARPFSRHGLAPPRAIPPTSSPVPGIRKHAGLADICSQAETPALGRSRPQGAVIWQHYQRHHRR